MAERAERLIADDPATAREPVTAEAIARRGEVIRWRCVLTNRL